MAELNDRLKRLVSDEQSMKKVLELASAIRERKAAAPPPAEEPVPAPPPSAPGAPAQGGDMAALLQGLLSGARPDGHAQETAGTGEPPPAAAPQEGEGTAQRDQTAALMEALPMLLQALSGKGELVDQDRANLIRAMTPYLSEGRIASLERAMRMANVTKAAKSALEILGR